MASEPRYPFDCWKFASSLSRVVVRLPLPSVLIYKLLQFKPPTQAKKGKVKKKKVKTENCGYKLFRIFELDYSLLHTVTWIPLARQEELQAQLRFAAVAFSYDFVQVPRPQPALERRIEKGAPGRQSLTFGQLARTLDD